MLDYKAELCDKISSLFIASGCTENPALMRLKLMQIVNEYSVDAKTEELTVWNGDKNAALIQRWIVSKAVSGCTERTVRYYKSSAERILVKIGKNIDDITPSDIQVYFAREISRGVSLTTVDNDKRVLSSLMSFLYREEIIRKNPMLKIDPIRREKKKKRAFSDMDIERIRMACTSSRDKALVEVLLSTACRVSELVSIKPGEIVDGKASVVGKGRKTRTIYFNARSLIAIEQYMNERHDANPYLFPKGIPLSSWPAEYRKPQNCKYWYSHPELICEGHADTSSIESIIRKIGKYAGVEDTHPHRFRRTCATNALRRGMPIEMVSKMLGHENIATTQIYLDLSEDDLMQAHRKLVT